MAKANHNSKSGSSHSSSNSKGKANSKASKPAKAPASKASSAAKPSKSTKGIVKGLVKAAAKAFKQPKAPTPVKTKASEKSVEPSNKNVKANKESIKEVAKESSKAATGSKAASVTERVSAAEKISSEKSSAADKNKKLKKTKPVKKESRKDSDELDLGDDLVGDEDLGSEDIPDLAEFDAIELEIDESEDLYELSSEGPKAPDEEVVLTDAEGRRYCRVRDCDQIGIVEGYCRFHYMQLWKRIQVRRKILIDGKLERYVEELTARYPDKFLEMIRKDLRTEKDFLGAIAELEIDESAVDSEFEDESASFIEEVRGMSESSSSMSDDEEF